MVEGRADDLLYYLYIVSFRTTSFLHKKLKVNFTSFSCKRTIVNLTLVLIDFGVNITDFNDYITKRNGTPVILGERFKQIFLSCEPNDHLAKANISWEHNSKQLNIPPPYRIPWSKGSVLMVRPLWEGRNDGLYECIAYSKYRGMVKRGVIISVRASKVQFISIISRIFLCLSIHLYYWNGINHKIDLSRLRQVSLKQSLGGSVIISAKRDCC